MPMGNPQARRGAGGSDGTNLTSLIAGPRNPRFHIFLKSLEIFAYRRLQDRARRLEMVSRSAFAYGSYLLCLPPARDDNIKSMFLLEQIVVSLTLKIAQNPLIFITQALS